MNNMKRITILDRREIDERTARLAVENSLSGGGRIFIGDFNPIRTGYGDHMCVPVNEPLSEERTDVGAFLELTREQAVDLHVKLTRVLFEEGS